MKKVIRDKDGIFFSLLASFNPFLHFCVQVSQAAAAAASSAVGGDVRHHLGQHNGGSTSGMPGHHTNQQMSQQDTLTPDLGEYTQRESRRWDTTDVIAVLESKHVEHVLNKLRNENF